VATTKAVLIVGGSGFIGTHLALRLREGYKVFSTYHSHPLAMPGVTFLPMAVSNRNWIKRLVYASQPDVIIYAAGKDDIARTEVDTREAEAIHSSGPGMIWTQAEIFQPKFIYLSNCYTFDGSKGNYRESDIVLPSTTLGKAKVAGENFIRGKSLNYNIVRASPLFGRGNGRVLSFFDQLRMKLDRGMRVELAADELHSFAPVSGFVDLISTLVDGGPRNKIIHYGGLNKLTFQEFGHLFAKRFGYDASLVSGAAPNAEPFDYSLNSSYCVQELKVQPLLLEESFDLIEKQLVPRF
jgi:dTDP-4-dehydrorhamnose reductase